MKRLMKRFLYFFSGLGLLLFMSYYVLKLFRISPFFEYVRSLENYYEFWFAHSIIVGLLFLMSLVLLVLAFRPSHRKRKLLWQTHSGDLEISKKSIESYIVKSISEFDHIRLNNLTTELKSKGDRKSIEANIEVLWLPSHDSSEASLEEINSYIKSKLEEFTNANVDGIKINVIDQALTDKRVV